MERQFACGRYFGKPCSCALDLQCYQYCGSDVPPLYPEELASCRSVCRGGKAKPCYRLGRAFRGGLKGVNFDPEQAARLYRRACTLGFAKACSELAGWLQGGGDGLDRAPDKAVRLLRAGCDAGHSESCCALAEALTKGDGVDRASEQAEAILERICPGDGSCKLCPGR